MNYSFVRRVTSSVLASFFAFSFGIDSFKSVNAEEEFKSYCELNADKFRIPLANEKPFKIAVINSDINAKLLSKRTEQLIGGQPGVITEEYQFKGLGNILAGKLSSNSNFRVTDWNRIKPLRPQEKVNEGKYRQEIAQNLINLDDLRKLRDKYGIEAVLVLTANEFLVNGTKARNYFLFGKTKTFNDVYVKLNFRLVDTTTGEIISSGEGNGNGNDSYRSKITTPTITVQQIDINKGKGWKPEITIQLTNDHKNQHQLINNSKTGIENKLLAEAVEDAINQVVKKLSSDSNKTACLLRIPTVIADIDENTVTLTKGKLHGFCEKMKLSFQISREPVEHPVTGKILNIKTKGIKDVEIELTEVRPDFSVGKITYTSGNIFKDKIERLFEKRELFAKPKSACGNQQAKSSADAKPNTHTSLTYPYSKVSRSADDLKLQHIFSLS